MAGESLSLYQPEGSDKKWAVVTPFAHPGDLVKVRVTAHGRLHSNADLLEIVEYDETHRGGPGDRRIFPEGGCKYFGVWYVSLSFGLPFDISATSCSVREIKIIADP